MGYKVADERNPKMGLHNKICKNPIYWCRLHRVWLSREDVIKKHCVKKPTFDMIGTKVCGNLEKKQPLESSC